MKTIYTTEPLEFDKPAIFLAGPSVRKKEHVSWRTEAHQILKDMNYTGTVLDPEQRNGAESIDFDKVGYPADWELAAIHLSHVILFWVDRRLPDMPGFTTNVEFGYYVRDERMIYGRPDGAPSTRYLDWLWNVAKQRKHYKLPIINDLKTLLTLAGECIDSAIEDELKYPAYYDGNQPVKKRQLTVEEQWGETVA